MKTLEERAKEYSSFHYNASDYVSVSRIGYIQGALTQQEIDIEKAKRAICSTCFTLRNNGECKGVEQLADEFEYCEFMKLFLTEMKGE